MPLVGRKIFFFYGISCIVCVIFLCRYWNVSNLKTAQHQPVFHLPGPSQQAWDIHYVKNVEHKKTSYQRIGQIGLNSTHAMVNPQMGDLDNVSASVNVKSRVGHLNKNRPIFITIYPPRGRLGNHMFQLASLIGIAVSHNFTPYLSKHSGSFVSIIFDLPRSLYINTKMVNEEHCQGDNFKNLKLLSLSHNWTLDGYMQNYKNFVDIQGKIHQHFTFKETILNRAKTFLNKNVPANDMRVAIHVRRSDFMNETETNLGRRVPNAGNGILQDYFKKAMDYFNIQNKSTTFIVVSDAKHWCLQNIRGSNIIYSPYKDPGIDMAILSLCDHVIMSVGSFGWWGAWLSRGTVIYYRDFLTPGSHLDKYCHKENYFPPDWIPMV